MSTPRQTYSKPYTTEPSLPRVSISLAGQWWRAVPPYRVLVDDHAELPQEAVGQARAAQRGQQLLHHLLCTLPHLPGAGPQHGHHSPVVHPANGGGPGQRDTLQNSLTSYVVNWLVGLKFEKKKKVLSNFSGDSFSKCLFQCEG